jgi:hypothetical protein
MKKNDFFLIGIVLLVSFALMGWHYLKTDSGKGSVVVTVDGEHYGTYDLDTEQTVNIQGTNTLQIKNKSAIITDADCPDKICVYHKPITRNGESIICLPNKIVVSIEKGERRILDGVTN